MSRWKPWIPLILTVTAIAAIAVWGIVFYEPPVPAPKPYTESSPPTLEPADLPSAVQQVLESKEKLDPEAAAELAKYLDKKPWEIESYERMRELEEMTKQLTVMTSTNRTTGTTTVKPAVEIVQWRFYTDPDFGGDGAVIWTGEVKNNSGEYIEAVWLQATFYDADGVITDTDEVVVTGLAPGATKAFKGYATYFGTEETGRIIVDRIY